MLFRDRPDGRRVTSLGGYGNVLPYIMRRRNESAVWFSKDIDVENALRFVKRKNAELGDNRYSLFGLFLAAAARTLQEKPRLNRFVHRRGIYQRNYLSFSFIVKKRLTEEAEEVSARITFEEGDTLDAVMARFEESVAKARAEANSADEGAIDKTIRLLQDIPGSKALFTTIFSILDRFNIAPRGLLDADPLFCSAYFANLGSIGLETPYHHLYEWGTASLFFVLGRMFQKDIPRQNGGVSPRHFVTFKATVDERIADGIYYAHALSLFNKYMQHPELLELPPAAGGQEEAGGD